MSIPLRRNALVFLLAFALVAAACNADSLGIFSPAPTQGNPPTPTTVLPTPSPAALITFRVQTPAGTPLDQPVYLNVLEEVNGLALNARAIAMEIEDPQHYAVTLPVTAGSVLKYRYSRQAETAAMIEHVSDGRQVRYRLYHALAPGTVEDVVSRWTDTPFTEATGRISGRAIDGASGQPLPNLLVAAGGAQALTASDGSFLIEGLPPGVHNLVLYALDGAYRTFQQGARVEAGSTTPAEVTLITAPLVNIVFVVSVPEGTIPAVPLRLAGNLYQLGNTFADLSGGVSTLAARMPALSVLPDGRYALALLLPAGADLHYLYTLGDGLWNTEKAPGALFPIRQVIVPESTTQVNDRVESWTAGDIAPITFDITVPANTPPEDTVSIQFNPLFGWTEPIPMWLLSDNRWAYVLNNLPGRVGELRYRFCRNDQCESAGEAGTLENSAGFSVVPGELPQTVVQTVSAWPWLEANPEQSELDTPPVAVRGESFLAGVELEPAFHPSWTPRSSSLLDAVQSTGANWAVLTPTWTFTRRDPPVLEPLAGRDPLWNDLSTWIETTHSRGLNIALFPTPHFAGSHADWWAAAPRDFSWWLVWFDRYRNFVLHHADLASRSQAQALILGGDWLAPALPGGLLADGSPSGVPVDAEERWRTLLAEVRARYGGQVFWALPYGHVSDPPAFLDAVDQVYLLFSEKLSEAQNPTQADLEAEAARLLDEGLLPLQARFEKPFILAAAYPSADGAATACLPNPGGGCLDPESLTQPNPALSGLNLDLQEQADIYNILFVVVNQRTWITGLVARGFYPPVILLDPSISVYGKPAQVVMAHWFSELLGLVSP